MRTTRLPKIVSVCVLAIVLSVSANAGPPGSADPALPGPYEIGFTYFMLTDGARNPEIGGRPIPVYLWYPVDPGDVDGATPEAVYPLAPGILGFSTTSSHWEAYGFDRAYQDPPPSQDAPFPLVVFSPGWGSTAWLHLYVGARLASHGIAVAISTHWGDGFWYPLEPFDHLAVACVNRPRDVSFMLSGLLARSGDADDPLFGLINPDQVAASGWSLGGYAAMVLAGGDDLVCDLAQNPDQGPAPAETCVPSPPDPRIKAIVPLDGSTQVLFFDELARIEVPTMGIGEEWSTLEATQGPPFASWQARLHAASQGRPAYRVDVAEALHSSFSNACEACEVAFDLGLYDQTQRDGCVFWNCEVPTIPEPLAYELTTQYMIAFLKANLAGEAGYQRFLTPGYALKEPYIEFFVTEKRNPNAIDEDYWPDEFIYFAHQPGSDHARAAKDPDQILPIPHMGLEVDW